jgi:hypothetical protein
MAIHIPASQFNIQFDFQDIPSIEKERERKKAEGKNTFREGRIMDQLD